jgi:hypothetical protein
MAHQELLAGRYVLVTSLTMARASTAQVVVAYRQLQDVERRFRVLKDFLHLRPVRHWTERRVRGHIAVCVYAAVIGALITRKLPNKPTCATPTYPISTAAPLGHCANSAASVPSPSPPATTPSTSSPAPSRSNARSSLPSTSTPPAGTALSSADTPQTRSPASM